MPPSSCTDQHALPFGSAVPAKRRRYNVDLLVVSDAGASFFFLGLQPQYGMMQRAALQKILLLVLRPLDYP